MRAKRLWFVGLLAVALMVVGSLVAACGDGVGACVGITGDSCDGNACYNNWDSSDCDHNNDNDVNGCDWSFHEGQTCDDRGLVADN